MLGDKIAELRELRRLTQEELAEKIGITRAALSHYEKNRREPDNATLGRFADFFGVTIDELLGRKKKGETKDISPEELTKLFESLPPEEQKAFLIRHIIPVLGDEPKK